MAPPNITIGHRSLKSLVDLAVGDLVMWTGKTSDYGLLYRRIIYQVVEKRDPIEDGHVVQYKFRAVFDFENPVGTPLTPSGYMSARDVKRISLLDLGIMRLTFDTFVKEWAQEQGMLTNLDDDEAK